MPRARAIHVRRVALLIVAAAPPHPLYPCYMWRIACLAHTAMAVRQIVFVRHGLSKMNVALGKQPWGSPNFVDPDIRDAPLEASGLAGARALREPLAQGAADVELVVASPLTRALATADAAFEDALTRGVPALVLPLAAERCYMTSDVGTPVSILREGVGRRFEFRREEFPSDNWWYGALEDSDAYAPPPTKDWRPPGRYRSTGEPVAAFRARMEALIAWLEARDEACIGLTCHWGVLAALTGQSFENCETRRVPLSELRVRTDIEY